MSRIRNPLANDVVFVSCDCKNCTCPSQQRHVLTIAVSLRLGHCSIQRCKFQNACLHAYSFTQTFRKNTAISCTEECIYYRGELRRSQDRRCHARPTLLVLQSVDATLSSFVAAAAAIEGAGCGTSILLWLNSKTRSCCASFSSCIVT